MFNFKNKFKLFDLFGIPVYLDITFGFILLMCLFDSPRFGLTIAVSLAFSIIAHEFGHALTARLFGYRTKDITLSLLGGCASLIALPRKHWQELLTAVAGPAVSFVLALHAWILLVFFGGVLPYGLIILLDVLFYTNLMLGLFNLLPALPMDGGRIFRSVLRFGMTRERATYIAMIVGRVCAVLLVVLPIFGIEHLGPIPIGGRLLLRLLIAWMIWQEGYREYLLSRIERDFRNWTQADFNARVSPPPYDR